MYRNTETSGESNDKNERNDLYIGDAENNEQGQNLLKGSGKMFRLEVGGGQEEDFMIIDEITPEEPITETKTIKFVEKAEEPHTYEDKSYEWLDEFSEKFPVRYGGVDDLSEGSMEDN